MENFHMTQSDINTAVLLFVSGSTFIGIVAHAVNTFPMPKSAIGRWFLGVIQYAVGQRLQGHSTMDGGGLLRATLDTAIEKEQAQRAEAIVSGKTKPEKLDP
jgi:hypothetical protein